MIVALPGLFSYLFLGDCKDESKGRKSGPKVGSKFGQSNNNT